VRGGNAWSWGNLCVRGALPRLVALGSEGVCVHLTPFLVRPARYGSFWPPPTWTKARPRRSSRECAHNVLKCVCVCARATAWDARLGQARRPRPDLSTRYVEGNCVCAMRVVCGMVVTRRGACVPSRRGERHTACSSWWAWACRGWRVGTPNSASSRSSDLKP